ncbi:unnamed protein product [Periconia digitata]|uniref:Uncharacterized protein n=1 Tax=Periconia digitata TaxID=1303443 RepID=A0A9W4UMT4_9PLEO|nr:unnamed protein product [Periconia digitata]
MNANPFDPWYESRLETKEIKSFMPDKWTYYTIESDAGQQEEVKADQLKPAEIDDWVLRRSLSKSSGVDILLARHTIDGVRHRPHECIPFEVDHLKSIFKQLSLPAQYFHIRTTSGIHCNGSMCRTHKDEAGNISQTTSVFRSGHGSITTASSVWSAAMRWDASTGRTIAFIEGLFDEDRNDLELYINTCSKFLGHPLMLPEILLHMVTFRLNELLRIPCEEEFYRYEQQTGLSNLPYFSKISHAAVYEWTLQDFQRATTVANRSLTNMVFLRRRFQFTTQYAEKLFSMLTEIKKSEFMNNEIAILIKKEDDCRQRLSDRILQSKIYEHQTECVQKRIENLNTVLYTVLSQINSKNQGELAKINLQIAQAVRSDSIPMRTIAYVTLVFLPGALIASIFGMNFFEFDSASNTVVVASSFWKYWAITIPFTLLVVAVWNVWNWFEKRKEFAGLRDVILLRQE